MLGSGENNTLTMQLFLDVFSRGTIRQASSSIASKRKTLLQSQRNIPEISYLVHREGNSAFDLKNIATCTGTVESGPVLQRRKGQILHEPAQEATFALTGSKYVWSKHTDNVNCGHWTTDSVGA